MPLDSLGHRQESSDEAFKRRCIGWELKYSFIPKRCSYTGKWLWFTLAYQGVSMLTGPGDPIFDVRWCERHEYLFLKIKGVI